MNVESGEIRKAGTDSRPFCPRWSLRSPQWIVLVAFFASCGDDVGGRFGGRYEGPVWHVDCDAPGPRHDGESWASALLHPQDAVDAASAGDEVWVAEGIYTRRDSADTVVLTMKDGVGIYGGYAGTELRRSKRDWSAHVTTLDGENTAYHLVVGASDAALDGFTVTGGNANGSSPDSEGGGMHNDGVSNLTVANCTFSGNTASSYGGGMYNSSSSPTVTNCTFLGNSTGRDGGGMYNRNSSPTVTNCVFSTNSASWVGGGMHNSESSPTVTNCIFSANSAGRDGGGMDNVLSSPTVTNCTFSGNTAGDYGGGMYNRYSSSPTLTNCIVWGNSAPTGPEIYDYGASFCAVSYSDVQGGCAGTGNINSDPLFVDAANGDLHLEAGSPCIDAADGDAAPGADIEGNVHRDDTGMADQGLGDPPYVDMGAFEFQGTSSGAWLEVWSPPASAWVGVGKDVEICWLAWGEVGDVSDVQIELSRDGGTTWEAISASTPNDRSHTWTVTDGGGPIPQEDCLIRVSDAADGIPAGASGPFAIFSGLWHVDADAPGPTHDGFSWTTAFLHPQDAMDTASNGNEVRVAEGTYRRRGGADTVVLTMRDGVAVYGGYAGYGEPTPDERNVGAHVTTLDGEDFACHVVVGASNATLDGFTISDGFARGSSPDCDGAGMYNDNVVNLVVENCMFRDGTTYSAGGGMYNQRSSLTVDSCVFINNIAPSGGGIYNYASCPTITNCTFTNNGAYSGGGMANIGRSFPTVANCTFSGNSAYTRGGAMFNHSSSCPTVTNCILWADTAPSGPEVAPEGPAWPPPQISYSDLQGCGGSGAGWDASIGTDGGGNIDSDPLLVNAPLRTDLAEGLGTTTTVEIVDAAINYAVGDVIEIMDDGVARTVSDVTGTTVTFAPALAAAPVGRTLVQNWGPGATDLDVDLHLSSGSPCVDTGTDVGAPDHDLDGNPRPAASGYDMGAYEYQP